MSIPAQLLVIAKEPVPGRAKTRLCPPLTPEQAATVAEAALLDTLRTVTAVDAARHVCVLDGRGGHWLPPSMHVVPQRGGGLDERLAAAFADSSRDLQLPMLLVGMDTPQVGVRTLTAALQSLLAPGVDAVLGRAADGGWWALGLRTPDPSLLVGVAMSTRHTGRMQRERLDAAGLHVVELPVLRDVDTAADARAVAASVPGSAFARAVAAVDLDDDEEAAS